jgi:predicted ATPase
MRFAASYIAEALDHAGRIPDGLRVIEDAIARAEPTEELWQFPELLRVKGELAAIAGCAGSRSNGEDHFRRALDWARRQDALSWELRAATSLARLLREHGRPAYAKALLQPVYDRFTEGFENGRSQGCKSASRRSPVAWTAFRSGGRAI